jgi:sugar lactone lactonase YvrE
MKSLVTVAVGLSLAAGTAAWGQKPSDPALLVPQVAPPLDYVAVPNPLPLPEGLSFGAAANLGFAPDGHLWVMARGPLAFFEFDENGKYLRSFGEGYTRTHGFRIDKDGNLWITDVGAHIVQKVSQKGEILMTLGTKGKAGVWDEAAGTRLFNEPNDVLIAPNGDFFVTQGHQPGAGKGDPRVFKFDKTGKFIKMWGGKGTGPGQFDVAHGMAMDAKGMLWITDRENQRIEIFDQNGTYISEVKFAGVPCDLDFVKDGIIMVNGFAGQVLKLDLNGKPLAALGKPGNGLGEFGEAHFVAVSPKGEIYVADSVNRNVQKFVKK